MERTRMRSHPRALWFAPLLALVLAAGCASNTTSIAESWTSPNARRGELKNVVTMAAVQDGVIRRTAEDKLAAQLQALGVHAVPSYSVLGDAEMRDRSL